MFNFKQHTQLFIFTIPLLSIYQFTLYNSFISTTQVSLTCLNILMHSFASLSTSDRTHESLAYFSSNSIQQQSVVLQIINSAILRDSEMGYIHTKDSPQIFKKQVVIQKKSFILMDKENSKTKIVAHQKIAKKIMEEENYQFICQINPTINHRRQTAFVLSRKEDLSCAQIEKDKLQYSDVFFSLKSFDNHHSFTHKLKDQNVIKFGKEIYNVRLNLQASKSRPIQFVPWNQRVYRQEHSIEGQCKICLLNQGIDQSDKILTPCHCSGSCSYIHLECLKNWISQKIQTVKVKSKLRTFDMKKFQCQICKAPYPKKIEVCKKMYQMIPEVQLQPGSLILQKMYPQQNSKHIHFITLQKGEHLTIGRNFANQLILDDMSVSRFHARITRTSKGELTLQDNNSKFGTFVNLDEQLPSCRQATLLTNKYTFKFGVEDRQKKKQVQEKGYLTDNDN